MRLAAYLLRRGAMAMATVVFATGLTFILVALSPGDTAAVVLQRVFLGDPTMGVDAADVAMVAERFGLDRPLLAQYAEWLGRAARLDFGQSLRTGRSVADELANRIPPTVILAGAAMLATLVLTLLLAMLARLSRRRAARGTVDALIVASVAAPTFYVGIALILVFALRLDLLPVSGFTSWRHGVLPAIALALGQFGFTTALFLGSLRETMARPFIVTARAKGLNDAEVFRSHALRNALVPVVPYAAMQFAFLLGGVVVVEQLFSVPGLGAYLIQALETRDGPAFLGAVAVIAVGVATTHIVADLLVVALDPRIRLSGAPA